MLFKVQKKKTESNNPKVSKTKNGKKKILSKSAVSDIKKSRFLKDQKPWIVK